MEPSFVTFFLISDKLILQPSSTQTSFHIPSIILLTGRGSQRQIRIMMVNLTLKKQLVVSRRRCYRKIDHYSRKEMSLIYATQV